MITADIRGERPIRMYVLNMKACARRDILALLGKKIMYEDIEDVKSADVKAA